MCTKNRSCCNSDVIDVTYDSRSRSRARQETRETSANIHKFEIKIEVKIKLEKQARDWRNKLQSFVPKDCNCNCWILN